MQMEPANYKLPVFVFFTAHHQLPVGRGGQACVFVCVCELSHIGRGAAIFMTSIPAV